MKRTLVAALPPVSLIALLVAALLFGASLQHPSPAAAAQNPQIIDISPNFGLGAGGTPVTITGQFFNTSPGGTRFKVGAGGGDFTNVTCLSDTTCTAVTPASGTPPGGLTDVGFIAEVDGGESKSSPRFIYYGQPVLESISPSSSGEGAIITLHGKVFPTGEEDAPGTVSIFFGSVQATRVTCLSIFACEVQVPAGSGTVQVTIATPGGVASGRPFTYIPQSTITNISPDFGSATGGTEVTITGTGFDTAPFTTRFLQGTTGPDFDNVVCTSTTTCTARTSASQFPVGIGETDRRSIFAFVNGQFSSTQPQFFYYGTPRLDAISPTAGPAAGGTTVTLTGAGFPTGGSNAPGTATVLFGNTPATGVSCSSTTTCTAVAPASLNATPVGVTIVTPGGASAGRTFTYGPIVTSITPTTGPAFGGTAVTISGGIFSTAAGGTTVQFGSAAATSVTCASTLSCTAIAPPGSGAVDVRVTVGGQTSAVTPMTRFSYVAPDASVMSVVGIPLVNGSSVPAGTLVQARVGTTLCGQGTVSGGQVTLQVFAATQIAGCGTSGAPVSFTIGGQAATATPPVLFQAGGLAKPQLIAGTPPAPTPTPAPTPKPNPAPTPAPQPQPAGQPMQVSGTVATINGPLQSGTVSALIGTTICGSAQIQKGTFQLSVASAATQPGCGTAGATVILRVGTEAAGSVSFVSGGSAKVALTVQ